jgi:hypothetical protein
MPPQARPGPRPDRLSGGRVMNLGRPVRVAEARGRAFRLPRAAAGRPDRAMPHFDRSTLVTVRRRFGFVRAMVLALALGAGLAPAVPLAHAASGRHELRNAAGKLLGTIKEVSAVRWEARLANGKLVGTYDPTGDDDGERGAHR